MGKISHYVITIVPNKPLAYNLRRIVHYVCIIYELNYHKSTIYVFIDSGVGFDDVESRKGMV